MIIAFLTTEYPHTKIGSSGGIGTSIKNLVTSLIRSNCKIFIIVYGQKADYVFKEDGITFILVKDLIIRGISYFLTIQKVNRIINKLIISEKIQILEVSDWTGFSAFLRVNCPVVMRLHGSDTYFCELDNRPVKSKNKYFEKRAFLKADSILAVSDFVGKKTNEVFALNRCYKVIPNGVYVRDFQICNNIKNTDEKIILYFGTLIRKKGLLELPLIFNKVIEKIPDAKLLLVGGDSSDIKLGSSSTWGLMQPLFSEKAKSNVEYIGKLPYSEVSAIIAKAKVCVFPSFAEALPLSWLEAMAMGKAIVASNIGWAIEMIDNGVEGYLRNPKNHEEYANSICELLENNSLSVQMGLNAINKVKVKFDSECIALMNIEAYQKVINK
jgi:glycosyltransferase involved in cell wall biosynthesis